MGTMKRRPVVTLACVWSGLWLAGCGGSEDWLGGAYTPYAPEAEEPGLSEGTPTALATPSPEAGTPTSTGEPTPTEGGEPTPTPSPSPVPTPGPCDDARSEPRTLYLSADDSNSQAAPVWVRHLIEAGSAVYQPVRPWEFLNHYGFDYTPAEAGALAIHPEIRAREVEGAGAPRYSLLVGVVAPEITPAARRRLNLTFAVDASGSMDGGGIERTRDSLNAIAGSLRSGDVVSIVQWDTSQTVLLDSHPVSGPDDATLLREISQLSAGGGTDLNAGLEAAYRLANHNFDAGGLNRVVLTSDGGANVGTVEADLIGEQAEDGDQEGVYLAGIGLASSPSGYAEELMNVVTDLGQGAYFYIDSAAEAERAFSGEAFVSAFDVAARDVQLSVTLPAGFVMERFDGEEVSEDPREVRPQHLAPNDAMLYRLVLVDCAAAARDPSAAFTFEVRWEDPKTRAAGVVRRTVTLADMLAGPDRQLIKAEAILAWVDLLNGVWELDAPERPDFVAAQRQKVEEAYQLTGDADLAEILRLLDLYAVYF